MKNVILDKSLNYLAPNVTNDLIRIGNNRDGGYVVTKKSILNCNCLISFGMADNFTIENDFLNYNKNNIVHVYDHTVNYLYFIKRIYKSFKRLFYFKSSIKNISIKIQDFVKYKKILRNKNFRHFREKVSKASSENTANFSKIINRLNNDSKIFLKSDIEGDEYVFFNDLLKHSEKINLIVVEFHNLDKDRYKFKDLIMKIKKIFHLVHLHGNNYSNYCEDGLPKVLEITFINKKYYKVLEDNFNKSFPIPGIDFPNIDDKEDLNFIFNI
tara:strand:- start:180 stop:989 length:810 start_codon:yes stop_codon:yes gene_type:complete